MIIPENDVYALIGDEGFQRLVAAFYRQVPTDPILGPMYPAEDISGAEHRLRGFLLFRFGGPANYIADRGHPRLRQRHAPFMIDEAARNRWVELMERSLDEAQLPQDATDTLRNFFSQTATFLQNQG
jgi:hemoglobin